MVEDVAISRGNHFGCFNSNEGMNWRRVGQGRRLGREGIRDQTEGLNDTIGGWPAALDVLKTELIVGFVIAEIEGPPLSGNGEGDVGSIQKKRPRIAIGIACIQLECARQVG